MNETITISRYELLRMETFYEEQLKLIRKMLQEGAIGKKDGVSTPSPQKGLKEKIDRAIKKRNKNLLKK